ncbi:NAD(P)-dependent oxidoreductase [Pseudonocardia sp. KRD-184]|uniref:NAD(P)-dependent oxidoreductase n=1 Tax=Pseudonocardia oceani TaxID=2792013 RepID=A0ABS6UCE1_9PSEU|nr:NAD(P)-dependent oxidoreductase [Pseudonocardia oceani]MBW0092081.1 NAD(P)-dependent oxidoreductase [Pseudonocardia oceani]MBW0099022.1 NAD(P)-dependent oxidoreductase [Pseudonocardia oceani]MBW0111588.1 NAD(P)-dependent oxidoreductase [Pseudonocardia oceani]MBW0124070.1 NAD(P)-dependent oxidoreductase [Pseudonocardia oceani]MBW0129539.1 NAD(P)-dependent oxidoreductase [Pseudonocardia oceani]
MTKTPTVALLGTGIMGSGMALNLLAAELPLRVWNRTADKALALGEAGAVVAATPAEAVEGADVIVTMLGDGHHVRDVMEQAQPSGGQVWAQMTTAGVDQTALLAIASERGLSFVDAPVVGTRAPAEQGTLLVLAAGSPGVRDVVQPVFDAVGRETRWVADTAGGLAASRLKLVVNSWVLAITAATGEAVALADGLGVDPQAFLDAVGGGPLDLPYLQAKAKAIRERDWTPSFSVANAAKDGDLISAAAEGAGVRLDLAPAAAARFHRTAGAGHGEDDMAANYLASFDDA